jgi:hypothetical protein
LAIAVSTCDATSGLLRRFLVWLWNCGSSTYVLRIATMPSRMSSSVMRHALGIQLVVLDVSPQRLAQRVPQPCSWVPPSGVGTPLTNEYIASSVDSVHARATSTFGSSERSR